MPPADSFVIPVEILKNVAACPFWAVVLEY